MFFSNGGAGERALGLCSKCEHVATATWMAGVWNLHGFGTGFEIHQRSAWRRGFWGDAVVRRGTPAFSDALAVAGSDPYRGGLLSGHRLECAASLGVISIPDSPWHHVRRFSYWAEPA